MSAATQRAGKLGVTFTERFAQMDGSRIRYFEVGQGNPVVVLHGGDGLTAPPLATLLAQHFRVIAFDIPGSDQASPRDTARTLTQAVAVVGLNHYMLVSAANYSLSALWQAIETPEQVDGLVLISPTALLSEGQISTSGFTHNAELDSRLADLQTPTLVLLGTNDKSLPPETGQRYVERLPHCYYVLVYDTGHAIATERPEALFSAVRDFVERRGAFIVERNNTAINP
jgi:pimeloyl-ACP methyl ester carboxylesterase